MTREMKNSGVDWIGEIPEEWKVVALKRIKDQQHPYPIGDGDHGSIKPEHYKNEGIPYIRVQNLSWGKDLLLDDVVYISDEVNNANEKSKLYPHDIVIAKTGGTIGKTCVIPESISCANTTSSVGKVTVSKTESYKYFFYVLSSDVCYQQMWDKARQKSAQPGFNIEDLIEFKIPYPKFQEQQKIANFLDKKCSEIDSVLAKTRASIEEYKKLKQSIITQAVTKGIRPNRKMKDSGIEWIGAIPEDWNVYKVRHFGLLQNGISKGSEFFGQGYPFVSYGDVYRNYELPNNMTGKIETTAEERERYSVKKGDIFFTRTSETIEEVGFSAVCNETIDNATFAGFLIRLRPEFKTINTNYAKYYFRSNHNRFYLVKEMNLVTRASLSQGLLNNMHVLYPDLCEQEKIADYLDRKCSEIDVLISKKEQLITELETYKKSLIYEYVTGKKEVK